MQIRKIENFTVKKLFCRLPKTDRKVKKKTPVEQN